MRYAPTSYALGALIASCPCLTGYSVHQRQGQWVIVGPRELTAEAKATVRKKWDELTHAEFPVITTSDSTIFDNCQAPATTYSDLRKVAEEMRSVQDRHLKQLLQNFAGVHFIIADELTMPFMNQDGYMLVIGKKLAERLKLADWLEAEVKS